MSLEPSFHALGQGMRLISAGDDVLPRDRLVGGPGDVGGAVRERDVLRGGFQDVSGDLGRLRLHLQGGFVCGRAIHRRRAQPNVPTPIGDSAVSPWVTLTLS